jgi:hypothetical protein
MNWSKACFASSTPIGLENMLAKSEVVNSIFSKPFEMKFYLNNKELYLEFHLTKKDKKPYLHYISSL